MDKWYFEMSALELPFATDSVLQIVPFFSGFDFESL